MKRPRHLAIAAACAVVLSLLLARVHPFGDAGLSTRNAADRIPRDASIPPSVRAMLDTSCADCHSSHPREPLYGRFAPVSWLIERDIVHARRKMNLTDWLQTTPEQQEVLRFKILQQARSGAMPLPQYRFLHRAALRPSDLRLLAAWAQGPSDSEPTSNAKLPPDPVRGQAVFQKRCTGCHALAFNREGPRLEGVFGRRIGAVLGFPYSDALLHANGTWNADTLDRWLAGPDEFLPGANMDFHVPRAQERVDIIAYFAQLSRP